MNTSSRFFRVILSAFIMANAIFYTEQTFAADTKACFWVVETNLRINNTSILKFYNDVNELLYSAELKGILDISSPTTTKILNSSLRRYLKGKKFKRKLRRNIVSITATQGRINYNENTPFLTICRRQ